MSNIILTSTPQGSHVMPRSHAKTDLFSKHHSLTSNKASQRHSINNLYWDKAASMNHKFPKSSGYSGLYSLTYDRDSIINDPAIVEAADYITIMADIKNLGEVNINYILNNMPAYKTIMLCLEDDYPNLKGELLTSRALSCLYAVNFYCKIEAYEYNLPDKYSRKMRKLEQDLTAHINEAQCSN